MNTGIIGRFRQMNADHGLVCYRWLARRGRTLYTFADGTQLCLDDAQHADLVAAGIEIRWRRAGHHQEKAA